MTVHFYEGQSYSWCYANRSYDDTGCWEDYLTPDEYEDALDRKRFEQSNRDWQASWTAVHQTRRTQPELVSWLC